MRQPDALVELLELWRRLVCRWLGHRWVWDGRAAPVCTPNVCLRCGKWERAR